MKKIGLILISTNKYKIFVRPLIESARNFLLKNHKVTYYLFTDSDEFDDLAKLILWSLDNWKSDESFMAINPNEHSILEIANIICNTLGISNDDIIFDSEKPMGQYRKPAISNAPEDFKFISLEEGIGQTINWFKIGRADV